MALSNIALREKYQELIDTANNTGVSNLQVREQDNVMYIDGSAPSEDVKKQVWDVYEKLDPDFRSGDLVLNLTAEAGAPAVTEYEVVSGDNLTRIGKKFGVSWREICEANPDLIKNADHIQVGWKLKIPTK